MVSKFLKKKSKRVPAGRRYKVEKWVKEHNRKERRKTKKVTKSGKLTKPNKKLIDVPGKAPFKEQILREAIQYKEQMEQDREKRRIQAQEQRKAAKTEGKVDLATLAKQAAARGEVFDTKKLKNGQSATERTIDTERENSRKAYFSEVKKVIESSDVVVQVLDARDPYGSRCPQLETTVLQSGKRLVLLLNKIDLIPKSNIEAWLKHLRRELPTVAFKASTQEQKNRLGFAGRDPTKTSKCVGADVLMRLLANYCRNKDVKTSIRVGVVGFPNVGKSSVINSLRRRHSCNVGAVPGITKSSQLIDLDQHIKLVDTPGVVMATQGDAVDLALRNAIRVEQIANPVHTVEGIIRRCSKDTLVMLYNVPDFDDAHEFLSRVAKKMGRLKKGGVADVKAAARAVINDWNGGKIRYYTMPPEVGGEQASTSAHVTSEIVSTFAKEFEVDTLQDDYHVAINDKPLENSSASVIPSSGFTDGFMEHEPQVVVEVPAEEMQDEDAMDDDGRQKTTPEDLLDGNQQLGKKKRVRFKKEIKKRKRAGKAASNLAEKMSNAMELGDYDFGEHFPKKN